VQASRGNGYDCTVKPTSCGADAYYAANYANAKAAGIKVGAYHRAFASGSSRAGARADARTESDLFISQVIAGGGIQPGDLLPVLDVETPFTGLTAGRLRIWVKTWMKRVRKRLGQRPMIYTNATSWRATGNTGVFARAGHRLWVAHWGVSAPSVPAANWLGRGWSVWQVTSSGSIAGISGRVDLNRLRAGLGPITVG
jgi:GH25 family lysozyme M1 (1,4-beta-N-acetylmuramidase)